MNGMEIIERTRRLSGMEMDALRSDEEILEVVNDAYLATIDVVGGDFREDKAEASLVEGDRSFDLPNAIEKPSHLDVVDGAGRPYPLEQVSVRSMDMTDPDQSGAPAVYALAGDTVLVHPTADGPYRVRVRGRFEVPELENTRDSEPVFASRFHPAVAYLAAAALLEEEAQFEEAERRAAQGQQFLVRMEEFYHRSDDKTPLVVGGGRRRRRARRPRRGRIW